MQGYVLGATDGEHMFQRSGEIVVKIDPTRHANDLSLGTQLMPPGVGVPRHVHAHWDEVIYVLDGSGFITLNDERRPIEKGATVFIPKGTWHGFENPDAELFVLWMTNSPGQAEFFRAIFQSSKRASQKSFAGGGTGNPPPGRSRPLAAGSIGALIVAVVAFP